MGAEHDESTDEEPDDAHDPADDAADRAAPDTQLLDERAFMLEVAAEWPPSGQFEFIGYLRPAGITVWVHPTAPAGSLAALLAANDLVRGAPSVTPSESADDVGRGVLLSADGRVFRERTSEVSARIAALASMPQFDAVAESTVSQVHAPGSTAVRNDDVPPLPDDRATDRHSEGGIAGSDDRELVVSSGSPWRKVGVALLRRSNTNIDALTGWGPGGSGAFIGPRAVLTAAHVVIDDGDDDEPKILAAGPAKRGDSWSGDDPPPNAAEGNDKFPWGLRRVSWYFWPEDHESGEFRYDYALVILRDLNWAPGRVGFGYQTTTWLDYKGYNLAGYPSDDESCKDSPDDDEKCGGYLYKNYGNITAVGKWSGVHYIDTQPGMSGGPVYELQESIDRRTIYFINVAQCDTSDCGMAKRLRKGSFRTLCGWIDVFPSSHFSNVDC